MPGTRPKILGLTGNIASGKSTVAAMLAERGAVVIDSDLLVRELYADRSFAQEIAGTFGPDALDASGQVDRKRLGTKVFGDPAALQVLEQLVHPAVDQLRSRKIAEKSATAPPIAFVNEAVKLIESGHARNCDAVWCVESTPQVQLQRLMNNRGLSEAEAATRLAAQPSRACKQELLASYAPGVPLTFLPNNGTREELARIVEEHWRQFLSDTRPGAG